MKSSSVQLRASKLFSAFFSRKTLIFEVLIYSNSWKFNYKLYCCINTKDVSH